MPTGVLTLVVGCGCHVVPSSNSFFTHIVLLTLERELIQTEITSGSDFTIYNYNLQFCNYFTPVGSVKWMSLMRLVIIREDASATSGTRPHISFMRHLKVQI